MPVTFPLSNADIAQVTIIQDYQGSVIMNVLHYMAATDSQVADGPGEITNLLTKVNTQVGSIGEQMRDNQVDVLTHVRALGQVVYPTRRPYMNLNLAINGDIALAGMPSNSAAVITKRGLHAGRGRTGSFHLCGFPIGSVTDASLTAGMQLALNGIGQLLEATLTGVAAGLSWKPVVAPPRAGDGGIANELVGTFSQPEVRVMRRRTLFRGI
jgi:hypothetical protein